MLSHTSTIAAGSPRRFWSAAVLAIAVTGGTAASAAAADDPADIEFFESRIRPVLAESCYECHSPDAETIEGGLRLDVAEALERGGHSGPAIVPGAPEQSLLLEMIASGEMPPDDPLPADVIADFEAWIQRGAPDPREADAATLEELDRGSGWSLEPIEDPAVPEVVATDWPRNAIDRFVLHRLESEDLSPVGDADRWTLVRRLYFDLTGLPPAPEEAEAFVNDDSPEALQRLVDRLLASPAFGEKWGRHWLDVARYAESSGREFNFTYPHAWPYRDYVIESFNADKPYDQFLREQLAGDLIAEQEDADWQRRDELHAATAFLAVGPKRHNAGPRDFHADMVDDQINVMSQAVLGLTVSCARCHDHKYDPIPTEDYYALAGIFRSIQVLDGTTEQQYSRYPTEAIPMGQAGQAMHEKAEAHEAEIDALRQDQEKTEQALEEAREALESADEQPEDAAADEEDAPEGDPSERVTELEAELADLEQRVEQLEADRPPRPQYTMGVHERDEPQEAQVAIGGDVWNLGDAVPRGFLSAIAMENTPGVPDDASGRLELARWLTSEQNPLTARVKVNRVWSHLFGRGLVPTVDNFGGLGAGPIHPDLLDHLARRFMDEGWSVKDLVRYIVTSRTYALSTEYKSAQFQSDPQNELLWRMSPRRLQVEQLRDAMLAVAGTLDRSAAEGSPITDLGVQLARGVDQEKMTPPSARRSVYQPIVRDYLPEVFQLFDFAAPSLVIGERAETTVPDQALYLLNSDFALDQAEAVAASVLDGDVDALDDEQRVDRAYRLVLSRPATDQEREEGVTFIRTVPGDAGEEDIHRQWTAFSQALLASAEFRYLMDGPLRGDGP